MKPARAFWTLAILTALWAPSSVSAAVNELASPTVSPDSGSTATGFTFRVRYEGRFDASSVQVTVAGRSIPMSLESGTLASGTWAAVATLPPGTWPTTFAAVATQGPSPALDGPSVNVITAATPAPTPEPKPDPEPQSVSSPAPATPPPAVVPAPTTTLASAAAAPSPAGPDGEAAAAGNPTPSPAGAANPSDGGRDAAGASTARTALSATPEHLGTGTDPDGRTGAAGLVGMVLAIGLAGVAAVAIIGTVWLLSGRRRSPEEPAADTAAAPADAATDDIPTEQRVPRRAPPRLADDPIVAALGIDDQMAARRAIRRAERAVLERGAAARGRAGRGRRP